jgi:hypothetical protein
MNNMIICRFKFYAFLSIIAPIDEGHHLKVLTKSVSSAILSLLAYCEKEQARGKS